MVKRKGDRVALGVATGLFAVWAAHDAEEWWTMGPWMRSRGLNISDRQVHIAIATMGASVLLATIDGVRTRGSSRLYQSALLAYGLHGFSHVGTSLAVRGYSPGAATTPAAVLGFWMVASRRLAVHGVRRPALELIPGAVALLSGSLASSHVIAAAVARWASQR